MKIYEKSFKGQNPFVIEYCLEGSNEGYFIVLCKLQNGKLEEREKSFVGGSKIKARKLLRELYKGSVTPIHLHSIIEDKKFEAKV